MRKINIIGFLLSALLLSSCIGSDLPPPVLEPMPERSPKKLAITEAVQVIHLPHHQAWDAIHQVFRTRNIRIASSELSSKTLYTKWEKITDSLCGTHSVSTAPLPCSIRFFVNLEPKGKSTSVMHIRYVQTCLGQGQSQIECPGSNAERLLMTLVEDIKSRKPASR